MDVVNATIKKLNSLQQCLILWKIILRQAREKYQVVYSDEQFLVDFQEKCENKNMISFMNFRTYQM